MNLDWVGFLDIVTNLKIRKNLIFDNLLMAIRWSFMENTCTMIIIRVLGCHLNRLNVPE